jgi:hypothetical protein
MGAFLGYGDIGVWASNSERDAFLNWFADNRCTPHDAKWEYCKSEGQRWMGRCIDLEDLIPRGEVLEVTDAERTMATARFGLCMGPLLGIISQITRGEWGHMISSKEAVNWRPVPSLRVMNSPDHWVAELTHVRETSLLATADLAFWKEKLRRMDLLPVATDDKAQILVVSTDARFMGIKFRELSFSVLVSRLEDGVQGDAAYLVRAFNSSRLLAFCERKFFLTPYYHADVRISANQPAFIHLAESDGGVFRAEMESCSTAPSKEPLRQAVEGWEGPIIFGHGSHTFFARLKGYTRTFPFIPGKDSITIRPSSNALVFQALIESDFVAKEWMIREDATHAKSKTYVRTKMLAGLLPA